jgi:tRNA (cmo5U34)-methyltransferase
MSIGQTFNETAAYYDSWVKKALPGYADLFNVALQVIPFAPDAPIAVLDLGAGTGLFSQYVLSRYFNATFVLYDLAEKMLEVARHRFQGRELQFRYVNGDYLTLARESEGAEQYDLVISSLSIHHLADEDKQRLFGSVYRLLRKPGMFLNLDQVRGETPDLQRLYWQQWLAHVRHAGGTEMEIQASIERRLTYDKDATLADQLGWLKTAGFVNVDCVYKHYFIGAFLAMKP